LLKKPWVTNTDIDIDGDKITVKDKEGGTLTLGSGEWPDIDYIPEFKQGQIVSATMTVRAM